MVGNIIKTNLQLKITIKRTVSVRNIAYYFRLYYRTCLEDKNMRSCLLIMMVVLAVMSLTEVYTLSLLFFALLLPEVTYTHRAMDIIDTK